MKPPPLWPSFWMLAESTKLLSFDGDDVNDRLPPGVEIAIINGVSVYQ